MLDFQFMASFWILVCFGVVGLPHTAVRCMAFKDSKALHRGMLIGTIVLSIIMLGMRTSWCAWQSGYSKFNGIRSSNSNINDKSHCRLLLRGFS